jgi:3-oxoacyl-[acyl-carrier protein] reductase
LVVVTGVSRGIGRAAALAFAERGCALALIGRDSERHRATVEDCRARGVRVEDFPCELADAEALQQTATALLAMGTPAVVLHNAAELERGAKVHELAVEAWDRMMAVNLRAPFVLTRALLPAMLAAGRGRVLFVSSVSGTIGCPEMAHYGASKWGLIGLSKALADELRGTGLQAMAVLPGSVDTDMLRKTPFPPDMSAEDVAQVIVFHALDAPDAMNGANVEVFG